MDALTKIANAFPQGAAVAREVELARAHPKQYIERFARRLDLRGISEPVRRLPWVALVDGLIARRSAQEIDHREEPRDFLPALRRIVAAPLRAALPSVKELDALAPADNAQLLKVVGDRLKGKGTALLNIDLGSDSYAVVALPVRVAAPLPALSREARGRITVLGGADLPALQRAHERAEQAAREGVQRKKRAAHAGGPAWQKLLEDDTFAGVVAGLTFIDEREEKTFVAAAAEAPPKHRVEALALAGLLTDPEKAVRKLEPLVALRMLAKLPHSDRRLAGYIGALAVLAKRIRLGTDTKQTTAFMNACRIYTTKRDAARRVVSAKTLESWKKIAEERFLSRRDPNAGVALFWLGDERTLEALLARTKKPNKDEMPSLAQSLTAYLAKAYGRRIGWPRLSD